MREALKQPNHSTPAAGGQAHKLHRGPDETKAKPMVETLGATILVGGDAHIARVASERDRRARQRGAQTATSCVRLGMSTSSRSSRPVPTPLGLVRYLREHDFRVLEVNQPHPHTSSARQERPDRRRDGRPPRIGRQGHDDPQVDHGDSSNRSGCCVSRATVPSRLAAPRWFSSPS
jgi:hypothetical protein